MNETGPGTPSRIVMLLDNHFGPDRRVLREVELLAATGQPVTIIAWDRRTEAGPISASLPTKVEVIRVHAPARPGAGARTLRALAHFYGRIIREHRGLLRRAALLVVHDLYLLPLGVFLRRLLGVRLAYDAHEDFALMEGGRLPEWGLRAIAGLETALARRAALIVVPGRIRQKRWVSAGFPPPVVLANTGTRRHAVGRTDPEWDLVYCGLIDDSRRPDLLLELAKARPDLRIAIAGDGRAARRVAEQSRGLTNLRFLGWIDDPEALLERARAIYYGLDPENPYAVAACPNNLYQAIRARRPLIFFCSGEPAELASRFRIGMRVRPEVQELALALDAMAADGNSWEFDAAWKAVDKFDAGREYIQAVTRVARPVAAKASARSQWLTGIWSR
jgi:glycosyltransferase involved in cell wall biosynthesis